MKTILALFVLSAVTFASHAATNCYNYSLKMTAVIQDSGSFTTATKYSYATKNLLADIARAQFSAGKYTNSTFPAGARLVYEYNTETSDGEFIVQDASRNLICSLSNVIWLKFSSPVANGTTSYYEETIVFDGTELGLNSRFEFSYLTAEAVKNGIHTCKGTSGTGTGTFNGLTAVLTGAASSSTK